MIVVPYGLLDGVPVVVARFLIPIYRGFIGRWKWGTPAIYRRTIKL